MRMRIVSEKMAIEWRPRYIDDFNSSFRLILIEACTPSK